ncbi:MAG: ABC transporter permease subunit [Treponema sp.]|jgi:putative aldouronate transport system permease protein|nr:ABC transporter permease subunit [Treponema sp.]
MKRGLVSKKGLSSLDLFVLPGLIYLLINNYFPMAGILIAFKKVDYAKGVFWSDWIGFKNFEYLFSTRDAFVITRNTLLYNAVFIVLGTALGLLVGIFLAEIVSKIFQRIYQTLILLPQLFSIIIVAYIVLAFLSNEAGFINKTILGPGREINFYAAPAYWPFLLTLVYLWKGLGYNSIIYLAAIVSVDRNLYEAATIDGVGRFKQVFCVTIPSIKPTIMTLVLISIGRIFYSDFGLFYQVPMNSGQLFNVTNTIDTYVYRSLLMLNNIGMASAAATFQAVIGFIVIILVNSLVRKFDRDNALF